MNVTRIKSVTVKTYTLDIEDGEVRPQPWSRSGRQYRVDRIEVVMRDGNISGITLRGSVLKKDGTEGMNRCDERLYGDKDRPAWLRSIIGGPRVTDLAIPLPWTRPPVNQNDRQHHHVKAKAVAQALTEARLAIRAADIKPIVGAGVTLHYRVPDNRRRDADNLAATLKVVQDALVQEGVLPDDSWVCVPSATCRIHAPGDEPAMWVELTDVTEFEVAPCTD